MVNSCLKLILTFIAKYILHKINNAAKEKISIMKLNIYSCLAIQNK